MATEKTTDPERRAKRLRMFRTLLESEPEITHEVFVQGRLSEVRSNLRRVLARRGLATTPEDEARIDACADLATLERWFDQALVAPSTAEALG